MRHRGMQCINCGVCGRDHWVPVANAAGVCPKRKLPYVIRVGKK
jgi:hypothetical protein